MGKNDLGSNFFNRHFAGLILLYKLVTIPNIVILLGHLRLLFPPRPMPPKPHRPNCQGTVSLPCMQDST